jgi:hypothetical protein
VHRGPAAFHEGELNWYSAVDDVIYLAGQPDPEEVITATCLCVGILCMRCKKNKIHRPISNTYDPETNTIEHWFWLSGMVPCRECKEKERKENQKIAIFPQVQRK